MVFKHTTGQGEASANTPKTRLARYRAPDPVRIPLKSMDCYRRPMSTAFEITDRYVDELCVLFPPLATSLGVPGSDHEWGDGFGLSGIEAGHDLAVRYRLELLAHVDDPDPRQSLAARITLTSIEEQLAAYESEDHFRDLRHMGSPFHQPRSIFEIMPSGSAEQWDNITRRLETIDQPYDDYRDRLDEGRRRGVTVARRQVKSVARQARDISGVNSSFHDIFDDADRLGYANDRLQRAVEHAKSAAGSFGEWLEREYIQSAVDEDGVGEEVYRRAADRLVGLDVDPSEAYQWGWEEFHRLLREMARVGEQIIPGSDFAEVKESLESDPRGTVNSTDELVEYVERLLSEAVEDLADTHFEVPGLIRPLTVQIAPAGAPLGVYYIRPSEDFSRPGGVWYSIGDQSVFPLYQHISTAYHEGFPGHHLQIGTAMSQKENLSRAQRALTYYPGYQEGWAMYAEVLMGELGYLENPKHYFGMLAKQMYRAARIVVDIGLHLSKTIADTSPTASGEPWTFERAAQFMEIYGFRTPAQAQAEVLRYLGWPGQAIAYKLGEREMLSIREETRFRLGADFDLKEFHATILNHGTMRLDSLGEVVRQSAEK